MSALSIKVQPIRGSGRISEIFPKGTLVLDPSPDSERIEKRAWITQRHGEQPLWEGYRDIRRGDEPAWGKGVRTSNQVRTRPRTGACFHRLVTALRPEIVIEFGTAFGVSGMFFLSAMEANGQGRLYTFDPNATWRELALKNLAAISDRFVSTLGTFEDTHASVLPGESPIDIAFVDGIHTADFVYPQVDLLKGLVRPGGVLILDDINASPDMLECWSDLARRDDVAASLQLGARIGLIELA